MANEIFYPKDHREKDNLINLIQTLLKIRFRKRTHVFDNIMIPPRKLFKEKDSVIVIKTRKSHHMTNSWSYVTIRELQARKHNQLSAIKTSFANRQDSEKRTSHDIKIEILEFSWNKNPFQKLLNLWKQPKGHKISKKLSRKRWQVINFSPLSSQNPSKTFSNWRFLRQIFTSDILKLISRFKIRTLKLAFSKSQQWSNTKVKKIYKSKRRVLHL